MGNNLTPGNTITSFTGNVTTGSNIIDNVSINPTGLEGSEIIESSGSIPTKTFVNSVYSVPPILNYSGINYACYMAVGSSINYTGMTTGTISSTLASINGTTLTLSGTISGTFAIGQLITGPGVLYGTVIMSGSGTSWTVNRSHNVSNITITATYNLTVPTDFNYPPTTGGYCIEFFIMWPGTVGTGTVFGTNTSNSTRIDISSSSAGTSNYQIFFTNPNYYNMPPVGNSSNNFFIFKPKTWYHIAFYGLNNFNYVAVNGKVYNTFDWGGSTSGAGRTGIWNLNPVSILNSTTQPFYISYFHIVSGYSLYTNTDFTPPTIPNLLGSTLLTCTNAIADQVSGKTQSLSVSPAPVMHSSNTAPGSLTLLNQITMSKNATITGTYTFNVVGQNVVRDDLNPTFLSQNTSPTTKTITKTASREDIDLIVLNANLITNKLIGWSR